MKSSKSSVPEAQDELASSLDRFRGLVRKAESSVDYWVDGPITEFIEDVWRLMEEQKVSRAELARRIAEQLARVFADGSTDAVYLVYNQFRSALVQVPTLQQLLPITHDAPSGADSADYLYEPDATALLDRLLRQYVTVLIHRAFLEATASEHGARMTAMDSATNNASDMMTEQVAMLLLPRAAHQHQMAILGLNVKYNQVGRGAGIA